MAKALHRSPVYLRSLQSRFELPVFPGAGYSKAYLAFLQTIVFFRILNVSEESLRALWQKEKKLLQLLHVDSTGSTTWFLDACGPATRRERRLLLSNYDMGAALPSGSLQLGLDFADTLPELFGGKEMGEDALQVLGDCLKSCLKIRSEASAEIPVVRAALRWARRFNS